MCCRLQEGYEPPQGKLSVDSCLPEGSLRLGEQPAQWSLSEDPEDRKDSLWIWGAWAACSIRRWLKSASRFAVSEEGGAG